ncbi:MAG: hypothetical protein ABR511_09380 [Acidimicrobiales bacterium]
MTGAEAATLALAVGAPVAALAAAALVSTAPRGDGGRGDRGWATAFVPAGAVVAAGAWLALVAGGATGSAGAFHVTPLVAAGLCGTALAAAAGAGRGAADGRPVNLSHARAAVRGGGGSSLAADARGMTTAVALTAVGVGFTAGAGTGLPVGAVAGLAVAGAFIVGAGAVGTGAVGTGAAEAGAAEGGVGGTAVTILGGEVPTAVVASAVGVVALAAGFVLAHAGSGRWSVGAGDAISGASSVAFLLGAALVTLAGSSSVARRAGPESMLVPAGLVVGMMAVSGHPGGGPLGEAAVLLAVGAVVAADARRMALSLGLLALAAAAGPPVVAPASLLLGAAAALVAAVGRPGAWLAALPGAASLAAGVSDDRGAVALVIGVAAMAVAALAGLGAGDPLPPVAASAADPTAADPTPADPNAADPTPADPTPADPADADPGRADADPGRADPTPADPGRADPTTAHAGPADPGGRPVLAGLGGVAVLPAAAVAAWLAVAPGTWGWTGARLAAYDRGALLALVAGVAAMAVDRILSAGRNHPLGPGTGPGAGRPSRPGESGRHLVTSSRRASKPRPRRATQSQRARPRARPDPSPWRWGRRPGRWGASWPRARRPRRPPPWRRP